MKALALIVAAVIVVACIWAGRDRRRKQRPLNPTPDERDWQGAFMRDCKRGFPRG